MTSVELIAPAGSTDAFLAACDAGADAVYLSLRIASGHSAWHGFTPAELAALTAHAHERRVAVHAVVDSVILEDELTGCLDPLVSVICQGVDLLVVQDLGLLSLVKRHFPAQAVQAGTAFGVHNEDGVRFLQDHGADRIALLPEVHVNDISRIVQATQAHVEIQVHGPLGYCLRGQCLFSSFATGESANRGRCSRPCNGLFQTGREPERIFATRDLDTTSIAARLARSGARSLRIGGRSLEAEAVTRWVREYRRAIRTETTPAESRPDGRARGRTTEARGSVGYYLGGKSDLLDPRVNPRRSQFVGSVQKMFQDSVGVTPEKTLRLGDRIFIRTADGQESAPFTIKEISIRNRRVRASRPGEMVRVRVSQVFQKGDEIHRLPQPSRAEEKRSRGGSAIGGYRQPLNLRVEWQEGRVGFSASFEGGPFSSSYEFSPAPEAVAVDGAARHFFDPPGSSPFALGQVAVEGVVKHGPSEWEFKALVTQFYRAAEEEIHLRRTRLIAHMVEDVRTPGIGGGPSPERPLYRVTLGKAEFLRDLESAPDVLWSLRVSPRKAEWIGQCIAESGLAWDSIALELPPWMWQGEREEYLNLIRSLAHHGPGAWVVDQPGQLKALACLKEAVNTNGHPGRVIVSSRGRCYNTATVRGLAAAGADVVSLSEEDGRENWQAVLDRVGAGRLEAPVYGHVALFTSRCRPEQLRDGAELQMVDGPAVIFRKQESWSEVRSRTPFSLTGEITNLARAGFRRFHLNLREAVSAEACREILAAARASRALENVASFNHRKGIV